jgi:hypothetical protein
MNDDNEIIERLTSVEKMAAWLEQRVWTGTGNLHDRVHVLEDKNGDRVHEISVLQSEYAKIERVLGLNGYGDKNIINDLKDAIDTIAKLKEGVISTKDFQTLMNDVDTLKKRGQAQLTLFNFVQFGIIQAVISFVMLLIMTRIFGATP